MFFFAKLGSLKWQIKSLRMACVLFKQISVKWCFFDAKIGRGSLGFLKFVKADTGLCIFLPSFFLFPDPLLCLFLKWRHPDLVGILSFMINKKARRANFCLFREGEIVSFLDSRSVIIDCTSIFEARYDERKEKKKQGTIEQKWEVEANLFWPFYSDQLWVLFCSVLFCFAVSVLYWSKNTRREGLELPA